MRTGRAQLFGVVTAVVALVSMRGAGARTLVAVRGSSLKAEATLRLKPGASGTLAHAIAHHRWKRRPVVEGQLPEPRFGAACPDPAMANVGDRFCVDRWEGSLEELRDDGLARPWPPSHALDGSRRYRAVARAGRVPQAYINGIQAGAACRAAGKRLCNASEWRFACSGPRGTVYPYGPTWVKGRCNDYGRSPMFAVHPDIAKTWSLVTNVHMNDPRLDELPGTVAPAGAHVGCKNDWEIFDMVGNLHEWVADENGTFQGGYFQDTRENGEGCAYRTTAHDVVYHDYSTGFRCCADLAGDEN